MPTDPGLLPTIYTLRWAQAIAGRKAYQSGFDPDPRRGKFSLILQKMRFGGGFVQKKNGK